MHTRWIAVAMGLVSLAGGPGTASGDQAVIADEQALLKLERDWVDAEIRHDARVLQAILHERFISTFGDGKPLGKQAFIEAVTGGPVDPTATQDLSDRTVIVVGETAVIVETDTVRKMKDSGPSVSAWRFTVTYVKTDGRWVALAEHGVPLRDR